MAYVVNPDGTVKFIEVKEGQYGNLKPTGNYDLLEKTKKSGVGYSGYTPPMPRKKGKRANEAPISPTVQITKLHQSHQLANKPRAL